MAKYERGQIWTIDLGMENKIGSEQKGEKLVCIVQNNMGNINAPTVIVAVVTSQQGKAKLPTHIDVPSSVGLKKESIILCEQLFTVDKQRLRFKIGKIKDIEDVKKLNNALGISMGLSW